MQQDNTVNKSWGWYKILSQGLLYKTKMLYVKPGCSLSMQKHFRREEFWYGIEGQGGIVVENDDAWPIGPGRTFDVPRNFWHQLYNTSTTDLLVVLEIQIGEECSEDDIERK